MTETLADNPNPLVMNSYPFVFLVVSKLSTRAASRAVSKSQNLFALISAMKYMIELHQPTLRLDGPQLLNIPVRVATIFGSHTFPSVRVSAIAARPPGQKL